MSFSNSVLSKKNQQVSVDLDCPAVPFLLQPRLQGTQQSKGFPRKRFSKAHLRKLAPQSLTNRLKFMTLSIQHPPPPAWYAKLYRERL